MRNTVEEVLPCVRHAGVESDTPGDHVRAGSIRVCWRLSVSCLGLMLLVLTPLWYSTAPAVEPVQAEVVERPVWDALGQGAIVLFRHALAPGIGDPSSFDLNDCASQRNLNEEGRVQARRMGERLKAQGIRIGAVWASQWCRTRETAQLMDVGPVTDAPAFNSFFADRDDEPGRTLLAHDRLSAWQGPGVLVVVTHQVNVSALTGIFLRSGEGVVLRPTEAGRGADGKGLEIVGRLPL